MEDNLSEREKLAARYKAMTADGLVDVKFLLRNTDEATTEQVAREVNAMYGALGRNDYKVLDFGDRTINLS